MKKNSLKNVLNSPRGNVYIARDGDGTVCLYYAVKPHRTYQQYSHDDEHSYWEVYPAPYAEALCCIKNASFWPVLDDIVKWKNKPMIVEVTLHINEN